MPAPPPDPTPDSPHCHECHSTDVVETVHDGLLGPWLICRACGYASPGPSATSSDVPSKKGRRADQSEARQT